jgi:hypothetical protein
MLLLRRQKIASGEQIDGGSNKPYHACSVNVSHCFKYCVSSILSKFGYLKHQIYEVTSSNTETLHVFGTSSLLLGYCQKY